MEEVLKQAALMGDIGAFYGVLQREPGILKTIEERDFAETPLHVAASAGNTDLAIEILRLKASFGKKLNPSGYSPLDMALRNGQRETVKQLIKFDPKLIGVQSREGMTPLHYVAETDDADLVAEFLVACPTAIKELTIRGETTVHLAVLRGSRNAFEVIMGWINRTDHKKVLKRKDNKGNTVLHIAAQTSQVEVIKRLIKEKVDLNVRNEENETALDIVLTSIRQSIQNPTTHNQEADAEIQKRLQQAGAKGSSELPNLMSMADILTSCKSSTWRKQAKAGVDMLKEDMSGLDHMRNAYLVMAVLIATATYQSVLSPPGGGWLISQNDNINSNATMHHDKGIDRDTSFYLFITVNSFAFLSSVMLTLMLTSPGHFVREEGIHGLLGCSVCSLMFSYALCAFIMTPLSKTNFTAAAMIIVVLTLLFLFVFGLFRDLWTIGLELLSSTNYTSIESEYEMEKKVRLGKYAAA